MPESGDIYLVLLDKRQVVGFFSNHTGAFCFYYSDEQGVARLEAIRKLSLIRKQGIAALSLDLKALYETTFNCLEVGSDVSWNEGDVEYSGTVTKGGYIITVSYDNGKKEISGPSNLFKLI